MHELSIYAVAWSKRSGLLASVGADGRIVLWEERFATGSSTQETETDSPSPPQGRPIPTKWVPIGVMEGAHGIYEVNHITWARRADRGREGDNKDEEVLITSGDDGSVKVWTVGR